MAIPIARALTAVILTATVLAVPAPAAARASPPTWRWPLDGRPRILRRFAPPPEPWLAGHRGVDLAAPAAVPVLAAGAGTVRFAGPVGGRGVVTVEHAGGLRTTYVPVTSSLAQGQSVEQGAKLGVLESPTDHCQEPCLHWGLLRGTRYLDPLLLLGHAPIRLLPFWQADSTASPEPGHHGSPPPSDLRTTPPPSATAVTAASPQGRWAAIPLQQAPAATATAAPIPPAPAAIATAAPVPPALAAIPTAAPVPPALAAIPTAAPVPPALAAIPTAAPVPPALAASRTSAPVPPALTASRTTTPSPPALTASWTTASPPALTARTTASPSATSATATAARPVHEALPPSPPAPFPTRSASATPVESAIALSALLGGFLLLNLATT
ncbi:M23 family metallopeptidase, partial [Nonomuraea deserti]